MFNIRDHGAVGDGTAYDTPAIQAAIDAAIAAGGGRVLVPAGTYRSGMIVLGSHIDLHLEPGAVIQGSHNLEDYPQQTSENSAGKDDHRRHLIMADGCKNVSITGRGTIDGQGPAFWKPRTNERHWIYAQPDRVSPCVEINECQDVLVEGITIHESPGWTLHLQCCDRVVIRGVRIDNHRFGPNNDGFDINGCRDVMIADCHIDTCDDAIVMKTTKNTRSCERITITNCVLSSNCAAIKCGTESWHDYRQIVVTNCIVTRSTRAFALYAFDGCTIEQIRISNLVSDTDLAFLLNNPIHIDARKRREDSLPSTIRDIRVSNFSTRTDGRILVTAADDTTIEDIDFDGIGIDYALFCDPFTVSPETTSAQSSLHSPEARGARAAVVVENVTRFKLRGLTVRWPTSTTCPGWGNGELRIENGGERIMGPADQGDDVAFSAVWLKNLTDSEVHAGHVSASDDRAPDHVAEACTNTNII